MNATSLRNSPFALSLSLNIRALLTRRALSLCLSPSRTLSLSCSSTALGGPAKSGNSSTRGHFFRSFSPSFFTFPFPFPAICARASLAYLSLLFLSHRPYIKPRPERLFFSLCLSPSQPRRSLSLSLSLAYLFSSVSPWVSALIRHSASADARSRANIYARGMQYICCIALSPAHLYILVYIAAGWLVKDYRREEARREFREPSLSPGEMSYALR